MNNGFYIGSISQFLMMKVYLNMFSVQKIGRTIKRLNLNECYHKKQQKRMITSVESLLVHWVLAACEVRICDLGDLSFSLYIPRIHTRIDRISRKVLFFPFLCLLQRFCGMCKFQTSNYTSFPDFSLSAACDQKGCYKSSNITVVKFFFCGGLEE